MIVDVQKYIGKLLNGNRNSNYIEVSDKLINEKILTLPPFGEFDINNGIWEVSNNRSVTRLIHGHTFLGDLIKSYEESRNNIYLECGLKIINNWIVENSEKYHDKSIYHDETTALRLNYWLSFINVLNIEYGENELEWFILSIDNTADLLYSDKFYAGNNNHGMFQNISLLLYSIMIDTIKSNKFQEKAIKRMLDYFYSCFTKEGVHVEQTPAYHYLISNKIKNLLELFQEIDYSVYEKLNALFMSTEKFGTYIIKPDGNVPQIGDNSAENIPLRTYSKLYESDNYKYAITMGQKGEKPDQSNIVFKDSGYAIFRNCWDVNGKGFYMLFNAAYNSNYHKHSDDLSLIIYKDGDIISEAGPNGYNYEDKFTQYAYSAYAHNSLIVNDTSLPRIDNKFDKVRIDESDITADKCSVTGVNERNEGTLHRRRIEYDKQYFIKVIDKISSKKQKNYKLFWNLAPSISTIIKSDKIILIRNGFWIGEIRLKCNEKYKVNIFNGQVEGNIKGWNFKSFGQQSPNDVIQIEVEGQNVTFYTDIEIFNEERDIELITKSIEECKINNRSKYMEFNDKFYPYVENKYKKIELENICSLIMNEGKYIVARGHKPVSINFDVFTWDNYENNLNTFKFRLHSLEIVEQLTQYFKITKNIELLNEAKKIIISWYKNNDILNWKTNVWGYYDQGTALRVFYILEFMNEYMKLDEDIELSKIIRNLLCETAELLCVDEFYSFNDNHGIFQDIALLAIALFINDKKHCKKWKKISKERLLIQLNNTISDEGVHLEHSPIYHWYIYSLLIKLDKWLEANKEDRSFLGNIIEDMEQFFIYIIKPNNTLPLFGDTIAKEFDVSYFENSKIIEEFKYIFSHGKNGKKPKYINRVYKKSGYVIFRKDWSYGKDDVYFSMTTNFNSIIHKHPDNLAFEIYSFGENILVDSGQYSYNRCKERMHVLSGMAHNVVLVNDKGISISKEKVGLSGILEYIEEDEFIKISAYNNAFDEITQKRIVTYDKKNKFLIEDICESINENSLKLTQVFNLAPSFKVYECAESEVTFKHNEKNIYVCISNKSEEKLEISINDGLVSFFNNRCEKNKIVGLTYTGIKFKFKTEISIYEMKERANIE